jgi:hypothetical protein
MNNRNLRKHFGKILVFLLCKQNPSDLATFYPLFASNE